MISLMKEVTTKEIQTDSDGHNTYPDDQPVELKLAGLGLANSPAGGYGGIGYSVYGSINSVIIEYLESSEEPFEQD